VNCQACVGDFCVVNIISFGSKHLVPATSKACEDWVEDESPSEGR
jgi:hypothetical protein